jgi:hypothetical protein
MDIFDLCPLENNQQKNYFQIKFLEINKKKKQRLAFFP